MPIYAYKCQACGQEIEAMQKISDPQLTECQACHGALKKMLTAPAFRLSGSGWYETDFKKDNKKNLAGEQSGSVAADNGSQPVTPPKESSTSAPSAAPADAT